MENWLKHINWPKVLLAGFFYLIIATLSRQVEAFLTMRYYMMPEFFGVWSKVMMPTAGPPPAGFYIISLVFTFITGIVLAAFFDLLQPMFPKDFLKKAFWYMDITLGMQVIFFTLPVYLLFNVPFGLLLNWLVTTVFVLFASSIVFAKIIPVRK